MAASIVTAIKPDLYSVPGNRRQLLADFTPSTVYPALGEPLTPALFGLSQIDYVEVQGPSDGTRFAVYDRTNNKLRIFTALSTEAGTGTDQSAKVFSLMVWGI